MVYKWYILPIGGLYATYHLLGEPETTIALFGVSSYPKTLANCSEVTFDMVLVLTCS